MNKDDSNTIFHDLATLSGAGISILEAAQIVASSYPDVVAWPDVVDHLSRGNTLAKALGESGLISRHEQEIISVAEVAGRMEQALTWLATSHEKRSQRVSQLRYKLILPFAVLLIGIAVLSILTLIKNSGDSVFPVLLQTAFILAVVFAITKLMFISLQKDSSNFIAHFELFRFCDFYKHLFEQVVFGTLLWNISSGIDYKNGFLRISKLINSRLLKKKLELTSFYCGQSFSVTESIKKADLPITSDFLQVLNIAEGSGRWEDVVQHHLKLQQVMLDLKIDTALEWVPRIYYLLTVLFVSSIIF